MSVRLSLALDAGFPLPDAGLIGVFGPTPDTDLSALPQDRVQVVQGFRPFHDQFAQAGFDTVTAPSARYAAAFVCLPRTKPLAQALVWQAMAQTDGPVAVDGQKTDGIDSMIRALKSRVDLSAPINKAHGKLIWAQATADAVSDWAPAETQLPGGYVTAPGCFSADGADPASVLLADVLPDKLGKRVVDLGAGWGYLSARLLEREAITRLDLVEADHTALTCARRNVVDPRAQFHWADALNWAPQETPDTVVMNPPFHTGRAADTALGQGFVTAAARMLPPHGTLWLVANRHLPYEPTLAARFSDWSEVAGDNRFKVLMARRPTRNRSRSGLS